MNKTIKRLIRCTVAIGLLAAITSQAQITLTNIFSFNGTNGGQPWVLVQAANNKFYGITQEGGPNYTGNPNTDVGGIFSITSDGVFSNLFFFENTNGSYGLYLTPGVDGNFYGTTSDTVFKLNPDGTMANPNLTPGLPTPSGPFGMIQDHDGTLYGTTQFGGSSGDYGIIYKIDTNGVFSTFVTFNGTNGADPITLFLGTDNNFYGITRIGGNDLTYYGNASNPSLSGDGTIFRMDRSGNLTNIFLFSDPHAQPSWLVQGSDGDLYGVTATGGTNGAGSIFRVTTNGILVWSFSFDITNGYFPVWLTTANDGNFYGVTGGSGYSAGSIFRITPNGSFTSLVQFDGTNDSDPGMIIQGTDGNLYGTAQGGGTFGQGTIFKLTLPHCPTNGLMETVVAAFGSTNGHTPFGELIQGSDGLLYGTTIEGGAFGFGTVFNSTLGGSLTSLFSFNGTNGAAPIMPLAQSPDGSFYGVTEYGGNGFAGTAFTGSGTIFKLSNGVVSTVFSFSGTNGAAPSSVIVGIDGNLYGVTFYGGAFTNDVPWGYQGDGMAFEITSDGQFTLLASFNGIKGALPCTLIQADNRDFYGITQNGGTYNLGTVFHMTTNGELGTLYSFDGTNGAVPATLIQGSDGALYGTASFGGPAYTGEFTGDGTVFRITTNGDFMPLAALDAPTTGNAPRGRLLEVCPGVFYGIAFAGGKSTTGVQNGTLFQVKTNGDLTLLRTFVHSLQLPCPPASGLIKGTDGNYYGVGPIDTGDWGLFAMRPIQAPVLQYSVQNGQINFTWNAWAGSQYTVMTTTNLAGGDWQLFFGNPLDVSSMPFTAQTNGPITFSDSIGPDAQRFYSVILQLP